MTAPFPPGDYDVVVVGSGPGGLQTSYWLRRFGVAHAVLSADEGPGGMFRKWPLFQRLITRTKPDAPFATSSREYEWFDHNSLVAEEPEHRGLVARRMDRAYAVPSRSEMEAGLTDFAERTGTQVQYGTPWEATRREADGRLVLETPAGPYRCRAAVFAIGMTEPWQAPIPGIEDVPHYQATGDPGSYAGQRVFVIGKRNSAFEIADALLPWAREVVLASPSPTDLAVLATASVASRYLQPIEDSSFGRGTVVLDAAVERVERASSGYRVVTRGTAEPVDLVFEVDAVIAATGFQTPVRDLPELGLTMVAQGRIPALTPMFESTSARGVFFAGNVTRGARGLVKNGVASRSSSLFGYRYNARVLAEHLAETLGVRPRPRPRLSLDDAASLLAHELARGPELWAQKGYLARTVALEGGEVADTGVVPLEAFVDSNEGDALGVTVEMSASGEISPCVYVRRGGRLREVPLDPDPLDAFDSAHHREALSQLLAG